MSRVWIPVSEKLPIELGCYLVAWIPTDETAEDVKRYTCSSTTHYYEILAFDPQEGWLEQIEQCEEYTILAWQPLPEPYKEASKDAE